MLSIRFLSSLNLERASEAFPRPRGLSDGKED
jgi:hypothetical protein